MKLWPRLIAPFHKRKSWLRQILVAALAASAAWVVGDTFSPGGGVVAAIVCSLSIRISLYKSVREGFGQILGTAIGAGIALLSVYVFHFGSFAVGVTVLLCSVVARALHLGEVASVNVPVTALIVIGPGISETTAVHRLYSTLIGAAIAIAFSYFSHPNTPAGRTIEQIRVLGRKSSILLSEMSDGSARGYTQAQAGSWLLRARLLVEEIPNLRSQAIEARQYAKWSPLAHRDEASVLYIQGVAIEHVIVQVRSIARTLFDISVGDGTEQSSNLLIAGTLSAASVAVSTKIEHAIVGSTDMETDVIAEDLRINAAVLAEEMMNRKKEMEQDQLIRNLSIVSSINIIADSLDESSPALKDVRTPEEPAANKVLKVSVAKQIKSLGRRSWSAIRIFLRR
jgi:uncharacterized membrane protein YgaE (UPF0421/DUF939 family)